MGGLKRVAKQCGGITVVKYDADGRKLGPFGCRCKTIRERMAGDGCDICNPELAKWYDDEALKDEEV